MKSDFKTNGNDAMFETEAQEIDMAGVTSLLESAPALRNRYSEKIVRQIQRAKMFFQSFSTVVVVETFDIRHSERMLSHSRELKHARFWDADVNRKWAVFTFNLPWHNHIHIAKYLFSIRDEQYKNAGDNTFLAYEMFSSGCRPRLKKAPA